MTLIAAVHVFFFFLLLISFRKSFIYNYIQIEVLIIIRARARVESSLGTARDDVNLARIPPADYIRKYFYCRDCIIIRVVINSNGLNISRWERIPIIVRNIFYYYHYL